jgi:hypothetical protein
VHVYLAVAAVLVSAVTFAAPPVGSAPAPHVALGMTEVACRSSIEGVSSAVADEKFPGWGVCLVSSRCDVETPFTTKFADRDVLWSKGDWFELSFSCRANGDGSCPEAKACAESKAKDKSFSWSRAKLYPTSTREPGDKMACKYASEIEPRMIVRQAKVESKWVRDAVCASSVQCNPKAADVVAVCKPRAANLDKLEIQCPSAMDCVAERFPLDKPKVEVAARPHGGTPAQTVSNSTGSTHSSGDQKR